MRVLVLSLFLMTSVLTFCQTDDVIASGRPGQAIGAQVLNTDVFQVQSGFTFNQLGTKKPIRNHAVFSNVYRFGLLKNLELSAVVNWEDLRFEEFATQNRTMFSGISNTEIGGRVLLLENSGLQPALALQGRLLLKWQSTDFKRQNLGTSFIVATSNKLSDNLSLNTNWGLLFDGNGSGGTFNYVINGTYALSNTWGTFVEIFGNLNDFSLNFDGGFYYFVNNNFQLDISAGRMREPSSNNFWFIDFGISLRTAQ